MCYFHFATSHSLNLFAHNTDVLTDLYMGKTNLSTILALYYIGVYIIGYVIDHSLFGCYVIIALHN